jgi:DNA polymerase III epsilon subunit-like protein
MSNNTDLMIDLETLDIKPSASILTIGAVRFDPFGDEINNSTCEKLYIKVDLDSCDRYGGTVNSATIDWWANQSQAAQDEAFDPNGRVPIEEAMNQLYKFAWGAKRVWSHGATFDIPICEFYFRKVGKAIPWQFWEARCTRTIFDIGINPNRPPVLKHHALEDAWNQAVGVQNVFKALQSSTKYDGGLITPFANQR